MPMIRSFRRSASLAATVTAFALTVTACSAPAQDDGVAAEAALGGGRGRGLGAGLDFNHMVFAVGYCAPSSDRDRRPSITVAPEADSIDADLIASVRMFGEEHSVSTDPSAPIPEGLACSYRNMEEGGRAWHWGDRLSLDFVRKDGRVVRASFTAPRWYGKPWTASLGGLDVTLEEVPATLADQ